MKVFKFLLALMIIVCAVLGVFTSCGLFGQTDTPGHQHSLELVDAKPATCTERGIVEHYICSCGKMFEDAEGTKEIYAPKAVDPLGHDEVAHEAKEPTCSESGWDAYVTCSRCDYTSYTEKPATGEHVDENKDSVCDKCESKMGAKFRFEAESAEVHNGTVNYPGVDSASGGVCVSYFRVGKVLIFTIISDKAENNVPITICGSSVSESGGNLVSISVEELAPMIKNNGVVLKNATGGFAGSTGFNWYNWSTVKGYVDLVEGANVITFTNLGPAMNMDYIEIETHVATLSWTPGIGATDCTDPGKDHVCDLCGNSVGIHDASYGSHYCEYCGEKITQCADADKDHRCDDCSEPVGTHEAASGSHVCGYCKEVVSLCEDNYDKGRVDTAATCNSDGQITYTCTVCGNTRSEVIPKTGHTDANGDSKCDDCQAYICQNHTAAAPVKEHEIPATCTESGEYYTTVYCSVCGFVISRENFTVDPLGHDFVLDVSGKLSYDASTDHYDASGLTVVIDCKICDGFDAEELQLFKVRPNGSVAGSYVVSTEWDGKTVSAIYGATVDDSGCVCSSFKVGGTLVYNVVDGSVDTSALAVSDAICSDCGKAITKFTVDVSNAFTSGIVVYCGGARVTLPALNLDNYTVSSEKTGGNDPNPILTTRFVSNGFTCNVITDDFLYAEGRIYSRYELSLLNSESLNVTYDGNTYIYDALSPITVKKEIRTYGCMLTITGEVSFDLADRWTHNNGIIFGTADKTADVYVKVTKSSNGNGIFLWDGANIVVNEGSTLNVGGTDSYAIWSGSRGSHITVDGTLISRGHIFLAPEIDWIHPEGDYYNSNPNLYVRRGVVEVNGNLLVNFIQIGSVKNDYTGKLTVKNGMIGCYSNADGDVNNKSHQIRWIFSKGELNFENAGSKIENAMKTDQNGKDRVVVFDSGINVKATGSYGYLLAHGWSSFTTLAIHADARFDLPAEMKVYNQAVNYASYYINVWNAATLTIDGVERTVWVANENIYKANQTFTYSQDDLLPVVNADGTRSAVRVAPGGSYTTAEGETLVGDWHFKKATNESGEVIYYYIVKSHSCESVCPQCGKCLDAGCTEKECNEKCDCQSDELVGPVNGGFVYNLMSFNIRRTASEGNPVNNWDNRKAAVVNFINNSGAHLIGLQEVTLSQFNYIKGNLSDKYMAVYFPREGGGDPEGLAIVYDRTVFNIVSDDRYWLSDTPDEMSKGWGEEYYRIAFAVVFENKLTGEYVKMVNTHGPLNDIARLNAYKLIMDRSVNDDCFTYLCGDFNTVPESAPYNAVDSKLQDCRVSADESANREHITFNNWGGNPDGNNPSLLIDFCFVSEGDNVDVLTYRVRTDRWGSGNLLSDHYAVQTTVFVKR